jgi:hypothetical protein
MDQDTFQGFVRLATVVAIIIGLIYLAKAVF